MTDRTDHELLAEFARSESEPAFAALVERHVNLVHSAALRFTGNAHHAQEITQAVFIILARKAGKLSRRVVLSGWLYQTARLTAANFMKGEIRRQHREQEAYMQSTLNEPVDAVWEQIAPLLEEAMGSLGETDRDAVVLHFFENRTAREVSAALKLTEAAVHKRTARALEKLRKFFVNRGMALSAVTIAGAVSANSVQAAPVGLAATVTATAAKGAGISAGMGALVKGTMKTMTWLKLKFVAGASVAALLAGGVATVAISETIRSGDKLTPQEIAKQSQDAYAALTSYSDSGTGVVNSSSTSATTRFNIRLQRPNLYRVAWTQTSEAYNSTGVVWSDGNGDFYVNATAGQEKDAQPSKLKDMQQAFAFALGVSGQATTVPVIFFKQNFGEILAVPASGRADTKKENDEKIGGVECHVLSYKIDAAKMLDKAKLPKDVAVRASGMTVITITTLWIGKRDHLIRQIRQTVEGMPQEGLPQVAPRLSDSDMKELLEKLHKPTTPEAIAAWRTQVEANWKKALNSKFEFTQTHENIVVNQKFSPSDFKR